jgi:hypothetical protein
MNEEPDNIVLRYLRRLDSRTDDLHTDVKDIKGPLTSLEE